MTGIKDFYGKNTPLVSDWLRKAYRSCVSNLKVLYVRYQYLSGEGGGVSRQLDEGVGGECHVFLVGNRSKLLGNWRFSCWEIA